jgi:hypothetical protein
MKRARETDPLSAAMRPSPDETSEQRIQREGALAIYSSYCLALSSYGTHLDILHAFYITHCRISIPAREREAKLISDEIDAEIEVENKRIKCANNVKVLLLGMLSSCFLGLRHSLPIQGQSESGKR